MLAPSASPALDLCAFAVPLQSAPAVTSALLHRHSLLAVSMARLLCCPHCSHPVYQPLGCAHWSVLEKMRAWGLLLAGAVRSALLDSVPAWFSEVGAQWKCWRAIPRALVVSRRSLPAPFLLWRASSSLLGSSSWRLCRHYLCSVDEPKKERLLFHCSSPNALPRPSCSRGRLPLCWASLLGFHKRERWTFRCHLASAYSSLLLQAIHSPSAARLRSCLAFCFHWLKRPCRSLKERDLIAISVLPRHHLAWPLSAHSH